MLWLVFGRGFVRVVEVACIAFSILELHNNIFFNNSQDTFSEFFRLKFSDPLLALELLFRTIVVNQCEPCPGLLQSFRDLNCVEPTFLVLDANGGITPQNLEVTSSAVSPKTRLL